MGMRGEAACRPGGAARPMYSKHCMHAFCGSQVQLLYLTDFFGRYDIMGIQELLLLAVGLSMDAFAVSVCKGLAMDKITWKRMCIVGAWFGGFQALMPAIGYLLGSMFAASITAFDHWIAFLLLGIIGGNMIREALSGDEESEKTNGSLAPKVMWMMAVATSIDALAVGVTFAFLETDILFAVLFIGGITFILSALGVKAGSVFGTRYKARAELAGGALLILLGCRILVEHMGWLRF